MGSGDIEDMYPNSPLFVRLWILAQSMSCCCDEITQLPRASCSGGEGPKTFGQYTVGILTSCWLNVRDEFERWKNDVNERKNM